MLQLCSELFVREQSSLSAVPGATIRVGPGIGGLGERAVSFKPVRRLGRSVDR